MRIDWAPRPPFGRVRTSVFRQDDPGQEAAELGLTNKALTQAEVPPAAIEIARDIAINASPAAVVASSRFLRDAFALSVPDLIAGENKAVYWLGRRRDTSESITAFIRKRAPMAPLASQYRLLFRWLCERLGKKMWVERSGGSLLLMPALLKHFPDAKFVHIVRDGRDVAWSMAAHPPVRHLAHMWQLARDAGFDLFRPPLRLGESRTLARLERLLAPLLSTDRMLRRQMPLDTIGAYWSDMVAVGQECFMRIPASQRYELRYEDLIAEPREEIRKFMAFIDARLVDETWLDQASTLPRRPGMRRNIPAAQWELLSSACEPGLELLGYPLS